MKILPFKESAAASLGTELEFQIIDLPTYSLASRAPQLLEKIEDKKTKVRIKPEITQSMIEVNTSIHRSPQEMFQELIELQELLISLSNDMNITFCGGGTHPFQEWASDKIFPSERYEKLAKIFCYLCSRATVFGQHVHIGCESGDDAVYLTHALARYVPQFIAICASSPFYLGNDTGYVSSRSTIFGGFPTSGLIPFLSNWQEFSEYFYKMCEWGIITSMKDIYWDVRPKPEFGTVEIRVFDCPLTLDKAVQISAYVQALCVYLLEHRSIKVSQNIYYLYGYNRFQACRYGFDGQFIEPETSKKMTIGDDILQTIKKIKWVADKFNSASYLSQLQEDVINKRCDSVWLRQIEEKVNSLPKVVEEQCKLWRKIK